MNSKEYAEKFKDPRWQKKRLEVLERDGWSCQACGDKKSTLNVHHKWYDKGNEPWEYGETCLVTLCDLCHNSEHATMPEYKEILLITLLGKGLLSADIIELALNLSYLSDEEIGILSNHRYAEKIKIGINK